MKAAICASLIYTKRKTLAPPNSATSSKLALSFKINPANLNLIFYNCTKTAADPRGKALVEMRCVNMTNAFFRAGVPYDATRAYAAMLRTAMVLVRLAVNVLDFLADVMRVK